MKLSDLHPQFLNEGGPGVSRKNADGEWVETPRVEGVGVLLDCPCGCDSPLYVPFKVALDGTQMPEDGHPRWDREGETFDTLTTKPSVLRVVAWGGCGWHGFITNGEVTSC